MGTRYFLCFFLIIPLFFTGCSKNQEEADSIDQTISLTKSGVQPGIASAYSFTEKEGYWRQFNSLEERIDALQIPEESLVHYTTEDLLVLCVTNPLNSIFAAYNCELRAVHVLADRLNVFKAFESREDAADVLLDFYKRSSVSAQQRDACLLTGKQYSLSLMACNFLELYIASARVPGVFVQERSKMLQDAAEAMFSFKISHPEEFSWFSYTKELLIMEAVNCGRILTCEDAEALYWKILTATPDTKSFSDDLGINVLRGLATLLTKGSKEVTAEVNCELTPTEEQRVLEKLYTEFPPLVMTEDERNSVTSTYNCHAYAWHIVDNNTPVGYYWINRTYDAANPENNLEKYWTEDYYQEIYDESMAEKIYYSVEDHSAIKSSIPGYYESKWGMGPLMIHTPANCPYLMSGMRYFAHLDDDDPIIPNPPGPDIPNPPGPDIPNPDDPDEDIVLPNPSALRISGPTSIRVGQSYTYTASQMFDTDLLEWSCQTDGLQITPSTGRTVSVSADNAGRYVLRVKYNMYNMELDSARLIIDVEWN